MKISKRPLGNDHAAMSGDVCFAQGGPGSIAKTVLTSISKNEGDTLKNMTPLNELLFLDFMRLFARDRGPQADLLSTRYRNNHTKLKWRCENGHPPFWMTWGHVSFERWCGKCGRARAARLRLRHSIEEMQQLASQRGGRCHSTQYVNTKTGMEWECAFGHRWRAPPDYILAGNWCRSCRGSNAERFTREILAQTFGCHFTKARPDWLRYTTGNNLELDGYNPSKRLAFEYQGRQHFHAESRFAATPAIGRNLHRRDAFKAKRCREENVRLIVVPHFSFDADISAGSVHVKSQMGAMIHHVLHYAKQAVPEYAEMLVSTGARLLKSKSLKRLAKAIFRDEFRLRLERVCRDKGGQLVEYFGGSEKASFRCHERHQWTALPRNVVRGKAWCGRCAKLAQAAKQRGGIALAQKAASTYGGACVASDAEYVNNRSSIKWRCARKHVFRRNLSHVQQGRWCAKCRKLQRLQQRSNAWRAQLIDVCALHRARVVSPPVDADTPVTIQCLHKQWTTRPERLIAGRWNCSDCKGAARKT